MAMTIVSGGVLLQIAEYDVNPWYTSYANSMWSVIMIVTTIGFGDIFPITIFGRIIATLIAVWGLTIFTILVSWVLNFFAFKPVENINF